LDDDHSHGGHTEPAERGGSSVIHPSDDWTSEEKGGKQSSPSTPTTSEASSEAGWNSRSPLDDSNTNRLSIQMLNPPREERITDACESTDGGRKNVEPDLTADKAKGDRWDDKEAEADDEEEEPDENNDENNSLLLGPTKQQCRSTASKKSSQKRDTKCRRISSPHSFNEEVEMGDESNIDSYTSSRPHHPSVPRSPSSHTTGSEGDTKSDDRMGFAGEQSWMVVICEQ